MRILTLEKGRELVRAARASIELYISTPLFDKKMVMKSLSNIDGKYGLFVTLNHHPTMELRGCSGFPIPIAPLHEEVIYAAISAAFEDQRFVPVSKNELGDLLVTVSILSEPKPVRGAAKERKKAIKVGRDGLMIEYGHYRGLLLPDVPVEFGWNEEKFLEEVCEKAGLDRKLWMQPNVKLFSFQSQIFRESAPNSDAEEVGLEVESA